MAIKKRQKRYLAYGILAGYACAWLGHFGFEKKERDEEQKIVLAESHGESIGVIVDSVSSVLRIQEDSIEPPASVIKGEGVDYIAGICKMNSSLIVLLDLTRIISDAESRSLKEVDLASAVMK